MRLAVVSPFLDRQHGTELCVIEQIERLARLYKWEIHLYSQKVQELQGVRLFGMSPDNIGGIFWHKVPDVPGPYLSKYVWWFLANQIQRRRDNRSGKFCEDLTYSPGINCLNADVIVVHIVFHEFYHRVKSQLILRRLPLRSWPRVIHRKLYYKLIMFLERRIYPDSNVRLIAVSHLLAKHLNVHFGRSDIAVIPNAVDTNRFSETTRLDRRLASRPGLGIEQNDFVLLLIGNDWQNKGLGTLLKACAMLSELPLQILVVGKDDPIFFRTLAGKLQIQDRLHFHAPSSDVMKFYAAADLYVSPSLEDSFGLPVLEAMACGLPVIASSHAGASELIRDGESGFILGDPQDHLQLAHLISRIYSNPTLHSETGKAASRYVLENCNWDKNTKQTREFLESVLASRTRL